MVDGLRSSPNFLPFPCCCTTSVSATFIDLPQHCFVYHSTAFSMASSVSFPNRPPFLPPRPPVRVPQNTCECRSSVSATMNLDRHPYPHDFDFTTASVAIARERAGSRTRPARYAPPSEHPYHTDNRQDPSVFEHQDQACHYPVSLNHVSCFLIITFARLLLCVYRY